MRIPIKLESKHYVILALIAIPFIILLRIFYKWLAIPFVFEEFLFFKGAIWDPFLMSMPLILGGIALNVFHMASTTNPPEVHANAGSIPFTGFLTSLMAGVMEEIVFRWVLFYAFFGMFWFIDRNILGGFLQAQFTNNLSFINTFLVFGAPEMISNPTNWATGLAILSSNWKFQEGHSYQGISGQIFSWLGGLVFFNVMFVHGLFAAMLVHFAFDMLTFVMLMVDLFLEENSDKFYAWY